MGFLSDSIRGLPPGWKKLLLPEMDKPYFQELSLFLEREFREQGEIFPKAAEVFRALHLVDFDQVRVLILGQDPYHGPDQAMGVCFAVPNQLSKKPPSLKNIFKEIESDLGVSVNKLGSELKTWSEDGVLLLNTVLTVRKAQAFSHRNRGWELFTDKIISLLNERERAVLFILWGGPARKKKALITRAHHPILESAHPSPLSAYQGFFGSRPFSKANQILRARGEKPVRWELTN